VSRAGVVQIGSMRSGEWQVDHWSGPAGALHALDWPDPLGPTVWVCGVDRPALVLGSSQRPEDVDLDWLDRAGIDVATRRSGGGAVMVDPTDTIWIDVLIPRDDPRWDDDVGRAFLWLGRAWVAALGDLDLVSAVHAGALECGAWGRRVCFAAIGSGEVTIAGAKAVGLSQRRTRAGARFQCVCYRRWDPAPMAALAIDPSVLPPVTVVDRAPDAVLAALVSHLSGGT
jgi:lipoate---protein ligase